MPEIDHIIFLVHGIRDRAPWMDEVKQAIDGDGRKVVPVKFGYFGPLAFLCPVPLHWRAMRVVQDEFRETRQQNTDVKKYSIIAHSFGTYLVTRILAKHEAGEFYRLVLCGGVIPESFRPKWKTISNSFLHTPLGDHIVNECGNADPWPAMAEAASWRYSRTGSSGLGTNYATDRFHEGRHSHFLNADFAKTYWVPFLDGSPLSELPSPAKQREALPWWIAWLARPPLYWFSRLLVALIYVAPLLALGWLVLSVFLFHGTLTTSDLRATAPRVAVQDSDGLRQPRGWADYAWLTLAAWGNSDLHVHGRLHFYQDSPPVIRLLWEDEKKTRVETFRLPDVVDVTFVDADLGKEVCLVGEIGEVGRRSITLASANTPAVYHEPSADQIDTAAEAKRLSEAIVTLHGRLVCIDDARERFVLDIRRGDGTEDALSVALNPTAGASFGDCNPELDEPDVIVQGRLDYTLGRPLLHSARRLSPSAETPAVHAVPNPP